MALVLNRTRQETYQKLSGQSGEPWCWFDITGQESRLRDLGIDPQKPYRNCTFAMPRVAVVSELDAYILLMNKVPLLEPNGLADQGLPLIRPYWPGSIIAKSTPVAEEGFAVTIPHISNR